MAARRWRGLVIAWKAFSYTLGALVIAFVVAQLWFYGHITRNNSDAIMKQREQLMQRLVTDAFNNVSIHLRLSERTANIERE